MKATANKGMSASKIHYALRMDSKSITTRKPKHTKIVWYGYTIEVYEDSDPDYEPYCTILNPYGENIGGRRGVDKAKTYIENWMHDLYAKYAVPFKFKRRIEE